MRGTTTLTLNGQQWPLRFNIAALMLFCEVQNIELHELEAAFKIDSKNATRTDLMRMLKMMQALIYAGMVTAAEFDGKEISFTHKQVAAWVGDLDMPEYQKVMTTCTRSMTELLGNLGAPKKGAKRQLGQSSLGV